ncbi:MAG TPA: 3-phosphoserine/phosphohydroxythreonine transaminase [Methylomusa anaerophila]|uniref:Phosphoserine aminotransferase n=1 Tax=Methylomusa anaerophila TaxID=1930071 RepID=A0A348AIR9_9FIRM|nr:3-phosphoserine/phosphohydroxythreonine transaminase [Methylomusa anaerophila]BBB90967.1 phosphoserine aminotransferase [Methylomusa anaerophila]HML90405.1 3-phosphoserine/phosphohydroxythreonine transaminase [Methylomusa anaerophila]
MAKTVKRVHNFYSGPAALPLSILQQAQAELLDFNGTGMSIMEISHRSKDYEAVHNRAIELLKELLGIPAGYDVLFLQGGASLQFAMVPMNFLAPGKKAGYVMTGTWAEKAYAQAEKLGEVFIAASAKEGNYRRIPSPGELNYGPDTAYLHITSNNTIFGTQWQSFPETGAVPLIADMSSDILSKPFDVSKFALIYAGAQKNLGPAGVTVVIIRHDLLDRANKKVPTMLRYETYAKDNSLYNTPPTFNIYMVSLMLAWVKEQGGLAALHRRNQEKAALVYDAIDASNGFYVGHAQPDVRSLMNITFRLANEDLEKKFLDAAKQAGFVGLAGHRSVGGCRASAYNAVPYESCLALRELMFTFQKENW